MDQEIKEQSKQHTMKIYFSGSIRGGQDDAAIYKQIIDELKRYGNVLTEHIGSKVLETNLSDEEIHDRDLKWVMEADVVVAEVTTPSLGVGYEIGRAAEFNKPIIWWFFVLNQAAIVKPAERSRHSSKAINRKKPVSPINAV